MFDEYNNPLRIIVLRTVVTPSTTVYDFLYRTRYVKL